MWVAAALAPDERYHVVSAEHNARASFTHQSAKACQTVQRRPLARWARYPAGVVVALTAQGVTVPGFYAAFISTETFTPRAEYGAGMAFADLLNTMCAQRLSPRDLHELVERVRRDYIVSG